MHWYFKVLSQYADFSGRAQRMEYWMFTLFNILIMLGLELMDAVLGIGPVFSGIYGLAVLIPSLAVAVRRLHDIDKSGWWLLVVVIPLLGALFLLYWFCIDGEYRTNTYGPNPKTASPSDDEPLRRQPQDRPAPPQNTNPDR